MSKRASVFGVKWILAQVCQIRVSGLLCADESGWMAGRRKGAFGCMPSAMPSLTLPSSIYRVIEFLTKEGGMSVGPSNDIKSGYCAFDTLYVEGGVYGFYS